jgi:hypothetical protein
VSRTLNQSWPPFQRVQDTTETDVTHGRRSYGRSVTVTTTRSYSGFGSRGTPLAAHGTNTISEGPRDGRYQILLGSWSEAGCGVYADATTITVAQVFR